jgi:hypothetical protein
MEMLALILVSILCACAAPIFRTDSFMPDTQRLNRLQPYLSRWATTPPEQTLAARKQIESQVKGVLYIDVLNPQTDDNRYVSYLVDVVSEGWRNWLKGYYYLDEGYKLIDLPMDSVTRQIDDHLYVFNRHEG